MPVFKNFLARFLLPLLLLTFAAAPSQAVDIVSTNGGDSSKLKQKPMIDTFYRQNNKRGLSVIGLSTDETTLRSKAAATYKKTKTSFPNFYFNGKNFQKEFQQLSGRRFLGTPTYMVFSPEGKLTDVHTGAVTQAMLNKAFSKKLKKDEFTPSVSVIQ